MAPRDAPGGPLPLPQVSGNVAFDRQRSVKREVIAHLGTFDFVVGKENVIFLGPPRAG